MWIILFLQASRRYHPLLCHPWLERGKKSALLYFLRDLSMKHNTGKRLYLHSSRESGSNIDWPQSGSLSSNSHSGPPQLGTCHYYVLLPFIHSLPRPHVFPFLCFFACLSFFLPFSPLPLFLSSTCLAFSLEVLPACPHVLQFYPNLLHETTQQVALEVCFSHQSSQGVSISQKGWAASCKIKSLLGWPVTLRGSGHLYSC